MLRSKIIAIIAMLCCLILCASVIVGCSGSVDPEDIVYAVETGDKINKTIEGGKIRGEYLDETQDVAVFKGIPYAAPPVGNNRWRAPQPVVAWEGVKECTEYGNSAVQGAQNPNGTYTEEFIVSNKNYSEDCLTLNVWTNGTGETQNRPVIVYFHGGAWVAGGSSCEAYEGDYIASQNAVYVSVNYRLGIFGFFASSELAEEGGGSTGNYGFQDMIKSLEWVRDNIGEFGGDKDNVTVMGQSAGAHLIHYLLASPKSQGLFKNAVIQSYGAMGTMAFCGKKEDVVKKGDALGSLASLRLMDAASASALDGNAMGVTLDGVYIDKPLGEAFAAGRGKDVNVIYGTVSDDVALCAMMDFGATFTNMSAEEMLMGSGYVLAKARAIGGANNTYCYNFTKVMPGKLLDSKGNPTDNDNASAFHTSDVPYFLNHLSDVRKDYWTDNDRQIGKICSQYLLNFARVGNPNSKSVTKWNPIVGNKEYVKISENGAELCTLKSSVLTRLKTKAESAGMKKEWFE